MESYFAQLITCLGEEENFVVVKDTFKDHDEEGKKQEGQKANQIM